MKPYILQCRDILGSHISTHPALRGSRRKVYIGVSLKISVKKIRCEGGFKVDPQRLPAQIPEYCPHLPLTIPSCTRTLGQVRVP